MLILTREFLNTRHNWSITIIYDKIHVCFLNDIVGMVNEPTRQFDIILGICKGLKLGTDADFIVTVDGSEFNMEEIIDGNWQLV